MAGPPTPPARGRNVRNGNSTDRGNGVSFDIELPDRVAEPSVRHRDPEKYNYGTDRIHVPMDNAARRSWTSNYSMDDVLADRDAALAAAAALGHGDDATSFMTDDSWNSTRRRAVLRRHIQQRRKKWKNRFSDPWIYVMKPFELVAKWWKKRRMLPPSPNGRRIPVRLLNMDDPLSPLPDDRRKGSKPYINNRVTSAIYTPYDFLPRQIIFQFSKRANLYFLFVSILQMIPSWSTTGNYTTIVPLMVFVCISIAREGYDDYCRFRTDKEENGRTVLVAREDENGQVDYKTTEWKDLQVGDIVRILQNEWIPADILLLHSSGMRGQASIETLALDGESTLKSRETPADLQELFMVDEIPRTADLGIEVVTEDPGIDLYNFEGTVHLQNKTLPLNNANVIYRGSVLRNTASCFALVIFSGQETKIQLNSSKNARAKSPKLQDKVNRIIELMALFVLLLSVFSMVASTVIQNHRFKDMWYVHGLHVTVIQNLMGFIIMFNTLIPLSLYVSMEICKIIQVVLMQNDVDMYDTVLDNRCNCQTSSLNEELGQVSYIFSDKTGTLTDNIMLFRKMSVAGYPFIHDLDLYFDDEALETSSISASVTSTQDSTKAPGYLFHKAKTRPSLDLISQVVALPRPSGFSLPRHSLALASMSRHSTGYPAMGRPSRDAGQPKWHSTANPRKPQETPSTLMLLEYAMTHPQSLFSQKVRFFLLALALCHTASPVVDLVTNVENNTENIEYLDYQASSPDELALVSAARDLGYLVIDRQHNSITVRTYPKGFEAEPVDDVYQVLDTIEFTSLRKRMSVIVRFPDGRICLFGKGADNVIIERLRSSLIPTITQKQEEIRQQTVLRKSIEADLVRKGRTSTSHGPLGERPSMSMSPVAAMLSLEEHLHRQSEDQTIQESGRRSMQARRSVDVHQLDSASLGGRHSFQSTGRRSEEANAMDDARSIATEAPTAFPAERQVLDDSFILTRTLEQIDEFSSEGLRTLMFGHRFLNSSEYESWKVEYDAARASLVDRQKNIDRVSEVIERDFEITGITAIEDKLQRGVPEAIEKLRRANIRMWMLTGDKRETAINIGYSCRLIKDYSTLVILHKDEDLSSKIMAALEELRAEQIAHCVVVVDGHTLQKMEEDETLFSLFIDLSLKADSVICCRASPAQKATMVQSVRRREPKKVTLAIGDGANDIAMIQSADLGIGIAGREGLQAARSSDYSIGQFRFLLKLLLVHGHWNYVRTCKYILSTFYKEFFFYMAQVVYQRNTMFTGTSMYESWSISMFNTLFTSLPVICMGALDRDLNPATLLAVPELYTMGSQNKAFGFTKFVLWLCVAMLQCVMTCFLVFNFWGENYGWHDNTMFPVGVAVFTSVVVIICYKLLFLEMHYITIFNFVAAGLSIGGYMAWNCFIGAIFALRPPKTYYVSYAFQDGFGRDANWWATVCVIIAIGIVFEVLLRLVRQAIRPTDIDAFEVLEKDPFIMQKLEQESQMELEQGWEAAEQLPTSWRSLFHGKLPAETPRSKRDVPTAITSRRRRRDRWLEKLHIGRGSEEIDREILEILERREREIEAQQLAA
ncbi:putative phospholipid-transporting ATPase DNF3 [Wickerhamiella sorbophila]|uniref:Phospholipid-transporting ATPase n=1 Tax=Wickerhamiella sorbophila TaxID=45607 RepID=A0A2T0FP52_9ASCO|nr:putative phospholipid-transporting ATPase DNF3 [Wickerhamiella sorbophila]PRT56771.1 putative phospholipid-transporting ATPase DNF3 [Wickerhamiella sorbophila]